MKINWWEVLALSLVVLSGMVTLSLLMLAACLLGTPC
jgi:hypothetical protein